MPACLVNITILTFKYISVNDYSLLYLVISIFHGQLILFAVRYILFCQVKVGVSFFICLSTFCNVKKEDVILPEDREDSQVWGKKVCL